MNLFDKLRGVSGQSTARKRALDDRSTVEIAARMKRLGNDRPREFPLRASAYLHRDRIILCRRTGCGLVAEVGEPIVLNADVDNETLGRTLCDQLLAYSTAKPGSFGEESAWAAFKAAGAKSMTQFQRDAWYVDVSARTSFLIEMTASPIKSLHEEISVVGRATAQHDELGAAFKRTLRGVVALRAAEIL